MTRAFDIESNIVYGMVSGTALLGDLYRPHAPNGIGLLHISGSGWHAPRDYGARPLKESAHVEIYVHPLAKKGFTVFTINHRAAPIFRYPAAVEDARRAMRFFRHNAATFGIDPVRMGAIGGSSGGHLVSMLALGESVGNPNSDDPVERESSAIQCAVTRAAPVDLMHREAKGRLVAFMGRVADDEPESDALYAEASPITYVSAEAPPFLLFHGTQDDVVSFWQSESMRDALQEQSIPVRLIPVEGAGHGPGMPGAVDPPDLIGEISGWFTEHLGI